MEIMTTKQASGLWGVTPRRVSEMCRGGRIEGAYKIGTASVSYTHLRAHETS